MFYSIKVTYYFPVKVHGYDTSPSYIVRSLGIVFFCNLKKIASPRSIFLKFANYVLHNMYMHRYTYSCLHIYVHTYIHTYTHIHLHTYIRTYTRAYVLVLYLYIYIYIYIYIIMVHVFVMLCLPSSSI